MNQSCISFQVVEQISKVQGVKKVLVAQHDSYKGFLPGKYHEGKLMPGVCLTFTQRANTY